ncbi:TPA: 23S rRNA (guanosine(2251)-2'-O)-methyltransferase RlmB [Patescibacteria group bacterium]|nr:MAG: tRNA/rRNA methyltransferase [Parcubacteria group bacterium GW2011_GWF2_40_10]KKR46986.1 MAG: tRNA/rRNA methyltransferase [Parcubacteria group bacterium GW2011_GWA2_40_143]KKR59183.1 MAG: tRNA/rRNA methyltransferase [Parcubacteria group bacterium GW2011_GWC2_40_31]KKR82330.1 MAG: tRNA/rRNA methyltransferase [Parcubacteria group bacterium GW2011_GWD2_40_9]HBB56511.1 23S rRNA (guanosine(2251)-2'-O)-methyltransferase RlmB [Patescibacteria group bacterium]
MKTKKNQNVYIYGRHAAMEALASPEKGLVRKVFLAPGLKDTELKDLARKAGATIAELSINRATDAELRDASHQGIVCLVDTDKLMISYKNFASNLKIEKDTLLVVLGELHDPQNIGAIIRSAAAFGAAGVLIPEHNQGQVTGSVIKVSAGMAFRVPLVSIGNVNSTLEDLKKKGFWIYGFASEGEKKLDEELFDAPTVFVFGNESKGVRLKTMEACDIRLSIPIDKRCDSLNVSASASVALYAWSLKHRIGTFA